MEVPAFNLEMSRKTIFQALLDAKAKYGGSMPIIEDAERKPITYDKLIISSIVLGKKLNEKLVDEKNIGLLIANSIAGIVTLFGLSAMGHSVAMLNFTAGYSNIKAACEAAQVKHIITAKKFIIQARLENLVRDLERHVKFIYLEDIGKEINAIDKALGLALSLNAAHYAKKSKPNDIAVILFTSGTEGAPKGVALSHTNLVANVKQVAYQINLKPEYSFFNPLPIFHCFGLTAGALLPIFEGKKVIVYPSPLQARTIVEFIRDSKTTILFATDTFVGQYLRVANDGDLDSLLLIVCGAEKVKKDTREAMINRFDVEILEGYGATEAAPVIAVNSPHEGNHHGSVGKLLAGIEHKLEPVAGIERGGRLYIKGPNLMQGYLRVDAPGELQPLADGWHDTGDIVEIDNEGYVHIIGRLKRFAKIGGEMISLAAVEGHAADLWPEYLHVACAIADHKKGEQIILLSNKPNAQRHDLQVYYKHNGIAEIALPRKIVFVDNIPILGTGKYDYISAQKIADLSL